MSMQTGKRLAASVLILCAMLLPLSIIEAEWAPGDIWLPAVSMIGLMFGAATGHWRVSRKIRWPLSAILGLLIAMLAAGLFTHAQVSLVKLTHWISDLMAGQAVNDPAMVTVWVTLWVWWASYSAAQGFASSGWALEAMLPLLSSMTIHSIYTRQGWAYAVMVLFGSVILMAWTALSKHQSSWDARAVDYPADLWPEWIGSSMIIATLACLLGLLLSVFTSQTTIEWMRKTVDPSITQVRQFAERMLGGANIHTLPGAPLGTGSGAFLPTSRLISDPPQLADDIVMWVKISEAPPPEYVPLPLQTSKPGWRGLSYSIYTGRGWDNASLDTRALPDVLPLLTSGIITQQFEIVAQHGDTLFALNHPLAGSGLAALYDTSQQLVGLRGARSRYIVVSRIIQIDEQLARQQPSSYPPELALYLQLPATLPQRVRDLAAEVTAGAATPYDKAIKVQAFLRTYPYTLTLPPPPANRDLVDYFLFDAPGGYCDYYASAMVIMLRSVGVPARLASGYTRGSYNDEHGAYLVAEDDAHSWPEVYLGGEWVEFEPTAGRPELERPRPTPTTELSARQVRAAQVWRERLTWLAWGVCGIVILIGAAIARQLWRERQLAALPAEELVPMLYQRLRQRAAWLGVDTRQSDTPDEFVPALKHKVEQLVAPARRKRWQNHIHITQQAAEQIGQIYRAQSYSPHKPGQQEKLLAIEAWRALRWRVWLMRLFKLIPRD